MWITKYAIKNNYVTYISVILLIIGGLYAFKQIPQAEDPGFTIRTAMVITVFPGASPERVESLVTDKIEKAVQEIEELDYIQSESKTGMSALYVNMKESYTNMRPIWDKLRRKMDGVKKDLPAGVYGPFVNDEFGDVFGTIISIKGKDYSYKELKKFTDFIRDEILRIEETAKAEIYGNIEEEIFIEFDNAKLAELGIPPFYIKQLLEAQNIIIPGGSIIVGDRERIVLEPTGNMESTEDIENIIIRLPENNKLYFLKDLATVTKAYKDPITQKVKMNGENSIMLAVSMRDSGNIINLGQKIKELLPKLENKLPYGVEIELLYDQSAAVKVAVDDFVINLIESILIVILVLLVSLGLRTGLLVSVMIPVVIVMTFILMMFFDIGIDRVSLGALLIALGMLVDNSIVVSESILVQMNEGKKIFDAAVDSSKELAKPLLISTLITSAAFLPIYLAESMVGEYTSALFKVVSISLLSSWVLSLTVIPLLCVKFMKRKVKKDKAVQEDDSMYNNKFYKIYRGFLLALVKNKIISFIIILSAFVGALVAFGKYVPVAFFPPSDRNILLMQINMPPSTPIERTEYVTAQIEKYFTDELKTNETRKEGIIKWGTFIGQSAPRYVLGHFPKPPSEDFGYILSEITDVKEFKNLKHKIETFCNENFPEITVIVKQIPTGIPLDYPVEVRVFGTDQTKMENVVNNIKNRLNTFDEINFVTDDWGMPAKKFVIKIDQIKAYYANITNQDVAISLLTVLSGIHINDFREESNIIPITLRANISDRNSIEKLENLEIYSLSSRSSVMLKQIATVQTEFEPSVVKRRDRLRTIIVQAALNDGVIASKVNEKIKKFMHEEELICGDDCKIELGGEAYESDKSNKSIGDKLPVAGLIIILLLVIQFNSLKKPLILILTIPLGLIGVSVGLILAHSYFGFMTLLGVVSLCGVIINNANVLMDRIRIEIEENNTNPADAIIYSAQMRLRPIMLTTLTTVGGLIPLWLGGGSLWEPLAIALIFGLSFATLLTLGVIPLLYATLHNIKFKGYVYKK